MEDIKIGLVDAVIVYQLDRLSRSVRDFANLFSLFEDKGIKFLSVKESIDTSTPIGKTMMYMSVVFAQMEREQIAARVADNMIGLAKKGYWVGGKPPIGYTKERITINGRKHVVLIPDEEGTKYIRWLIDAFLEAGKSLQGMETYFKQQGIRSRSGAFFSAAQIFQLLSSPYGVPDSLEVYDYFAAKGCQMAQPRDAWDGTHGLIIYGRTTENGTHGLSNPEKWIVAIGHHAPILDADKWLKVQARFNLNKIDKTMKYAVPMLKGAVRCSCGVLMSVARKQRKKGVSSWYYCPARMRKGTEVCQMHAIKVESLDSKVLDIFTQIAADPEVIKEYAEKHEKKAGRTDKAIQADIAKAQTRIRKLTEAIYTASGSSATKYIVEEIERLDGALKGFQQELSLLAAQKQIEKQSNKSLTDKAEQISQLVNDMSSYDDKQLNELTKTLVKFCAWDGNTLFLTL